MSRRTSRVLRVAAAAMAVAVWPAPAAVAVSPPQVDDRWLPEPAPPSPPQPTVQRQTCTVPIDDARSGGLSQLAALDMSEVWRLSRGSGQRVAVIDTGVAPHPRMRNVVAGGDYVFAGDGTQDCDGHGTVVAGIIAAASGSGDSFTGVAPEATVISIRQSSTVFGPVADPASVGVGDVDTLARAVRTAADLGASVINISSVACTPAEAVLDDRALGAALAYAVDVKNAVVVAAAGNTGGAGQCPAQKAETTWDTAAVVVSPAWYDDYVLTVGSVNVDGTASAFSLAGPWVDVAAPGEKVVSLSPVGDGLVNAVGGRDGAVPIVGTSYAAPVVSGLAALIRSRFPSLTARQVMARIEATAHHPPDGWNPVVGNGVVDALAAVSTDAPMQTAAPDTARAPIIAPPQPTPPDRRPRDIAFAGAAVCLAVLTVAVTTGTAGGRLRRPRPGRGAARDDGVAGP